MYERFTDRARKVMQLANQEAQRFNHEYIGTEHVLLGLVKEGSGVAANVLKNLDVDLRMIRLEVEKLLMTCASSMVTMGNLPQTPRAKKVIEYSIEESRNLNNNHVGTEHIFLGLLREEEGIASQVLRSLGLTYDKCRQGIVDLYKNSEACPVWNGQYIVFAECCDSVPLIGPPDGWPRTKDGHLLKPGMTVYLNELACHVSVIKLGPHGNFLAVYDSKLKSQNIILDTTDVTFDPPSPSTVESVLRQLVNGIQNGSTADVKRLAALAKDALDRNQL